jgi:hypothetical protein
MSFIAAGYTMAHNPAAWVGIVWCLICLGIWIDRDTIHLKKGKRDHEG